MIPAIEARGLSRVIAAPWGEVTALPEVSLMVPAGTSAAVIGPSGSGKSTLLNLLGLLDTPTAGDYWIAGQRAAGLSERRRVRLRSTHLGFVFQSFHLIPHKSVLQNVALSLGYAGVARREREERATELLARVGLSHRRDASPATLSGGERQRAAVARAVVHEPQVLLCDEPTGNLDQAASSVVLELLFEVAREHGTALVVVTHDDTVARHCDVQLEIAGGQLESPDSGAA